MKKAVELPNFQGVGVALVIGVTGIVGNSLAEILPCPETSGGPWKVYGVARRPQPDWIADRPVNYIQCDVSDRGDTIAKLSPLTDVTHIFYVCWTNQQSEIKNCEVNGRMLRNVLDAVIPVAAGLQHFCLLTGTKQYVGPFDHFDGRLSHEPPFREDLPRLPIPNFYYTLEDILIEAAGEHGGLTWSVHRATIIFGCSPSSYISFVSAFCAYASVRKHEGSDQLPFPGSQTMWETFADAADADLVSEQMIWAAVDPRAKNEAFNCTNGDVFRWKHLWPVFAEQFGMKGVGPDSGSGVRLEEEMNGKEKVWEEIVRMHKLRPMNVNEVGNWAVMDAVLGSNFTIVSSMNKSKEHGFLGFRNTFDSLRSWIHKTKVYRMAP